MSLAEALACDLVLATGVERAIAIAQGVYARSLQGNASSEDAGTYARRRCSPSSPARLQDANERANVARDAGAARRSSTPSVPCPRTGVIYVTSEATQARVLVRRPRLVQPRPGSARDRRAPRRAAARAQPSRSRPTIRSTRRSPGSGSCARRSPASTTASTAGHAVAVHGRERRASPAAGARRSRARRRASGSINLGHFLPDYTAYEELLDIFKAFTRIPILLDGERGYGFTAEDLRREILGRGLSALLLSNPCNPTGKLVAGEELDALGRRRARARLHAAPRRVLFALHLSRPPGRAAGRERRALREGRRQAIRSCIFDGLTKNWRYPGWRITWALGAEAGHRALRERRLVPRRRRLEAAAARGDPAASRTTTSTKETLAIQNVVPREARPHALAPRAAWASASTACPTGRSTPGATSPSLPAPLNDGMGLFRAALAKKVITVPGEFFDVNPGKRRHGPASRFRNYVRFSFGPSQARLDLALTRLEELVAGR